MACLTGVIPNQLKSSKIVWGATSKAITDSIAVAGLSSASNTLEQAILATGLSIGSINFNDSNCLLSSFEVESIQGQADTACYVNATYTGYDFYGSTTTAFGGTVPDNTNLLYQYGQALNQDQTNFDPANVNNPILVYYWPPPATVGVFTANTQQQGATIPVLKPYSQKSVKFFYTAPVGWPDDTITALLQYVGQYNTDTWDSGDPTTWLCTGVTTTVVGLPNQVLVECSFYYKPETWYQWAFFKDPLNNGSPIGAHKDITDPTQAGGKSNGCRGFLPYTGISFIDSFGFN